MAKDLLERLSDLENHHGRLWLRTRSLGWEGRSTTSPPEGFCIERILEHKKWEAISAVI